jgi:hypothetical protein
LPCHNHCEACSSITSTWQSTQCSQSQSLPQHTDGRLREIIFI